MGDTTHFIQYTGGSNLKINVNDFILDAFDNTNKKGIYFNSNPNPAENTIPTENQQGYYFVIGKDDSFISLDSKGKFIIQTNDDFTLNAWNESASKGVVISNNPTASQPYYLAVGDGDDYIRVKNNGISLSSHIFTLNAWNNNQGIYLNSQPGKDYYLKIGNMSGSTPLEFIEKKLKENNKSFWNYPLDFYNNLQDQEPDIVLVDCTYYDGKQFIQEYRWFEV